MWYFQENGPNTEKDRALGIASLALGIASCFFPTHLAGLRNQGPYQRSPAPGIGATHGPLLHKGLRSVRAAGIKEEGKVGTGSMPHSDRVLHLPSPQRKSDTTLEKIHPQLK